MENLRYAVTLSGFVLLFALLGLAQVEDERRPLVLSDAVLPTTSKNPLLDPRIFNPEFYRKFNPSLALTTDQEAIQQWTSSGANHCLRASFNFNATDYIIATQISDYRPGTVMLQFGSL